AAASARLELLPALVGRVEFLLQPRELEVRGGNGGAVLLVEAGIVHRVRAPRDLRLELLDACRQLLELARLAVAELAPGRRRGRSGGRRRFHRCRSRRRLRLCRWWPALPQPVAVA